MPMITKFSIVYHGGYNLYNSGFATGLVASIMIPTIQELKVGYDKRRK